VTCNGTMCLLIRTYGELRTALDPNVVGDDDEDGVALKKRNPVDGFAAKRMRGATDAFVDHRIPDRTARRPWRQSPATSEYTPPLHNCKSPHSTCHAVLRLFAFRWTVCYRIRPQFDIYIVKVYPSFPPWAIGVQLIHTESPGPSASGSPCYA